MARPLKEKSDEALEQKLWIRLTKSQKQTLSEHAELSGMTESDYIRFKIFGDPPRQPKATPERAAFIKALGMLGFIRSDINQILKDRFAHQFVNPDRAEKAFSDIREIADALHDLLGTGV